MLDISRDADMRISLFVPVWWDCVSPVKVGRKGLLFLSHCGNFVYFLSVWRTKMDTRVNKNLPDSLWVSFRGYRFFFLKKGKKSNKKTSIIHGKKYIFTFGVAAELSFPRSGIIKHIGAVRRFTHSEKSIRLQSKSNTFDSVITSYYTTLWSLSRFHYKQ